MINNKMIQGALAMLAGMIPKEEYEKATAALNQIAALMQSCDDRLKRIEENQLDFRHRLGLVEAALHADSETFRSAHLEAVMWTPDNVAAALAPAKDGGLNG